MKTKKLMRKTLAVAMAAAMLCTGAAVIPQLTDSQITAKAVSNNSDNPSILNTNQSITDSLGNYETGYYSFTLKNASKVSFTFKQHAQYEVDGSAVDISVYNEKNESVFNKEFNNKTSVQQTANTGLPAGTYYISINNSIYKSVEYDFKVNASSAANWETEYNDNKENADQLNLNKEYFGAFSGNDVADWYKFELKEASVVSFRMKHADIKTGSECWFLDMEISDNSFFTPSYTYKFKGNKTDETTYSVGLPKGTYWFCITADHSLLDSDGDYRLTVNATPASDWERESNESDKEANPISLNKEYHGTIYGNGDYDFYTFELSSTKNIKVLFNHSKLSGYEKQWDVTVHRFEEYGNVEIPDIDMLGYANNTKESTKNFRLEKGKYVLVVNKRNYENNEGVVYGVMVQEQIAPTSVSLNKTSLTVFKGASQTVTATVNPSNATNKSVTWTSSDNNIATVSNGKITGKNTGTATITAKTSNGKTASCKVTVKPAVTLNKTSLTLGKGETYKLNAKVDSSISNKTVAWRTSNSKIATVDKNGNVKTVGTGKVWITAKASNGGEQACTIEVKNAPSKVTISKGVVTIGVGEKFTVGSGIDAGAACSKRTYRTSNSSFVKTTRTDWQGDFVGVKPGVAYVTVRTYNGKESTCKVTVKKAPTSVGLNKTSITLKVGQTASLSAVLPFDVGCAARTFRTSNSSVVKMTKTNWTGEFKAMKKGTAYVTVRTYNGKEKSCKVTVV